MSGHLLALKRSTLIDAVRGVAILFVLTFHYFATAIVHRIPVLKAPVAMLWTGVDLFFILSGYLLGGILLKNKNAGSFFAPFYGRRALRILPLYAICLVIYYCLSLRSGGEPFWPFALFLQNIKWGIEERWGDPLMEPTWSLAVEEQFYLILPLLIRFCPRNALPRLLLALIVAAPILRAGLYAFGYRQGIYYFMPCRMDTLFLGVLIAWARQQSREPFFLKPTVLLGTALISGCGFAALIWFREAPFDLGMAVIGYSVIAVFYGACLLLLLKSRFSANISGPLSLFGLGAYSLYLFHEPVLIFFARTFGQTLPMLLGATVAICTIAWVCWVFIEKPCIALGHQLFPYKGSSGPRLGTRS